MPYPSGRLLARGQQLSNLLMPNTVTVARTAKTVKCRVRTDGTSTVGLPDLPSVVNVQRWLLTLPQGTDVAVGDQLTVTSGAVYTVLLIDNPSSYSIDNGCRCVMTKTASGAWPVVTNQSISFRNPRKTLAPITTNAFVHPLSYDAQLGDVDAEFTHIIVFDPSITYSDATAVAPDHEVTWSGLRTPRHAAVIGRLRQHFTPLPYASVLIKDRD